jgi:hypothetical protein
MHSTAMLILANGHIGELMAEADRDRLSRRTRTVDRPTTSSSWATRLAPAAAVRSLVRLVRPVPRATPC